MAEEKTFSAKQVATRIGTEAKVLRKFFRDPNSGFKAVGQGGRYDFDETDIPKIKAAFDTWNKGKVKRHRPTAAERALAEKTEAVPKKRRETSDEPPAPRRRKNEAAPSPLDEDDLSTRLRMSIGERARARGITTDRTGRWIEVPKPRPNKLMTLQTAKATLPGFSTEDERKAARVAESKRLFDEALAQAKAEDRDPTDEELDSLDELLEEL